MSNVKLAFIFFVFFIYGKFALSQAFEKAVSNLGYNGTINDFLYQNDTLVLGGSFSYMGNSTGSGRILDGTSGTPLSNNIGFINGTVYCSVADGKGGWYIGGRFDYIGNIKRKNLAHINSDGSLGLMDIPVDNTVRTLALSGDTLFIGGGFKQVGLVARSYVAAISIQNSSILSWNPNPNNSVLAIHIINDKVFIGGLFTSVMGQSRNRAAKIERSNGSPDSWNPNINAPVRSIDSYGDTIFVAGEFSSIGGNLAKIIGAVDANSGQKLSWNPNLDATYCMACATFQVEKVKVYNGKVYAGGYFYGIAGVAHSGLAELDLTTAGYTSPFYNVGGSALDFDIYNNVLYVSSENSSANVVAIDLITKTGVIFQANSQSSAPRTIKYSSGKVFVGGNFKFINPPPLSGLAGYDFTTNTHFDLGLNVNGAVNCIRKVGNKLYIGGTFTTVGGLSRNNLARINLSDFTVDSWNPSTNASVLDIQISGQKVFVAGNFTTVNGSSRNYIAALDTITGTTLAWNCPLNGAPTSILSHHDKLYVTGQFTLANGISRSNVACIDTITGIVDPWNPALNGRSNKIQIQSGRVFIAGNFTTVNGISRPYLADIDSATGTLNAWNPFASGEVKDILVVDTLVFAGGNFNTISGQSRKNIAAISTVSAQVFSWNPSPNSSVLKISKFNNTIAIGGYFSKIENHNGNPALYSLTNPGLTLPRNIIQGNIYADINGSCSKDINEKNYQEFFVRAEPGGYYGVSDKNGNYQIAVDTSSYNVNVIVPSAYNYIQNTCFSSGHFVPLSTYNQTINNIDFPLLVNPCQAVKINIESSRRRVCAKGFTKISYCNMGGLDLNNVEFIVVYPSSITPISSSIPWVNKTGNEIVFSIPNLNQLDCGEITLIDSVNCMPGLLRGISACVSVYLKERNNCIMDNPSWDKSSIKVQGECYQNQWGRFYIQNSGSGDMADSSEYRVFYDNVLVHTGNFKLRSTDTLILNIPASGQTIRVEADQRLFHPGTSRPRASLEGCGLINTTISSERIGLITKTPLDNSNLSHKTTCATIVNSFDPNDKSVVPSGLTSNNYISQNDNLEFVIRFQNTGTDTAYNIVIIDTLDENLDVTTFLMEMASHNYSLDFSQNKVLKWTFNNINLPDSSINNLLSNGFIKYSISPVASLNKGTILRNKAFIYFDYNSPIITNETTVTIHDTSFANLNAGSGIISGPLTAIINSVVPEIKLKIFPNPSRESVTIIIPENNPNYEIIVSDLLGNKILNEFFQGQEYVLNRSGIPSGLFLIKIKSEDQLIGTGKIIIID